MQWSSDITQVAASGLLMGLAYALVAVGFTIVFGVMNVVNFAHGHIVMAAMFASFALNRYLGLDPYIAALCLFPIFLVVGALLYRMVDTPADWRKSGDTNAGHAWLADRDREHRQPHFRRRLAQRSLADRRRFTALRRAWCCRCRA